MSSRNHCRRQKRTCDNKPGSCTHKHSIAFSPASAAERNRWIYLCIWGRSVVYKPDVLGRNGATDPDNRSHLQTSHSGDLEAWDGDGQISLATSTRNFLVREIKAREDSFQDIQWLQQFPALWEVNAPEKRGLNWAWNVISLFLQRPHWPCIWII
jgi:hypothetical protein